MISYSDYVLAERPWAYWPLNDPSLYYVSSDSQTLIDVSGNNRHLTAKHSDKIAYQRPIPTISNIPNFPSDSLPVRGLQIMGGADVTMSNIVSESGNGYVYLGSGLDAHSNDVIKENPYISHQLFRRKVRAEFLIGLPLAPAPQPSGCGLSSYAILSIGGLVLWMNTIWFKACGNCSCEMMASWLSLSYTCQKTYHYPSGSPSYSTNFNHTIWSSGYLIGADNQLVCTTPTNCSHVSEAAGTGFINKSRRFIFEIEYIDDLNMVFFIGINNSAPIRIDASFPSGIVYEMEHLVSNKFLYTSFYTDISLISITSAISNLSVYYDKEISNDYINASWHALTNPYVAGVCLDTVEISDNLFSNIDQTAIPNTLVMQLDSLLVRGISHKKFYHIGAETIDGGSRITLYIGELENEKYTQNYWVPDYKIGDVISLEGSTQPGLNGCWRVEDLGFNSVVFTTNTPFVDETGYFVAKRAPVGGGVWSRNAAFMYSSSASILGNGVTFNDTNKSVATATLSGGSSVVWKKNLKRPPGHYLGTDVDYPIAHWTILGDHLSFILVIGYKQNPRTHSRILVFGDFNDPNDNVLKTILIGYGFTGDDIGDVGFNKIFEYLMPTFSDNGTLQLGLRSHQPSGIGWIYSDRQGNVDYLHGTKDCGQHQYPILLP